MVAARHFYGAKLGLTAGRSTATTHEYNFFGHHLVLHKVAAQYRCQDFRSCASSIPFLFLSRISSSHHSLAFCFAV
jgi:extradiol dioxygenase family protein